jgi:hypothetical protein
MASKLSSGPEKHTGYLAAYFGLLLFSVSGLILQGGIWLFVGIFCWSVVVITCVLLRSMTGSAKNLKDCTSKSDACLGREQGRF